MDDTHVFLVEAEQSPLKGLTKAWWRAGGDSDIRCGWMDLRYRNKNLGEWVGRSVEGHYYKSGVPLNYEETVIPIGSYFVCSKVEKNLPFMADGAELLDEDMVGDRATFETLHPETGARLRYLLGAPEWIPSVRENHEPDGVHRHRSDRTLNEMATKTATNKSNTATKKPTWSVITFKQIESRRQQLGFSKSGIAKALGVTNSTYHNWQRGTTVPHPTQQDSIKSILAALVPGLVITAPAVGASGRSKGSAKGGAKGSASGGSGHPVRRTGSRTARNVGGGSSTMPSVNAEGHPFYLSIPESVQGIAQITSAWISSQNKAPSAGSVYEFVDGLKDVLGG